MGFTGDRESEAWMRWSQGGFVTGAVLPVDGGLLAGMQGFGGGGVRPRGT